jgi:hypothetical protein
LSISNVPVVTVVVAATAACVAVQSLASVAAVNGSFPDALTFWILDELVVDPLGPNEPTLLSMI